MMRSPYQSPKDEPPSRFLRRRPDERRKLRYVYLGLGLVGTYLVYWFLLSDTGLLRIASLRRENESLQARSEEHT